MPISITGTGTITGLSAGGLPDDCITTAEIAGSAVTTAKILDANITSAKLAQPMTLGTALAYNWNGLTTNTSLDFTGIPSWAKRITVMFDGVSSNGATDFQIQIGSGTMSTASYASVNAFAGISGGYTTSTSGLLVNVAIGAGNSSRGIAVLSLIGSNTWVYSSVLNRQDGYAYMGSGSSPALAGSLDRVRITAGGTDTFDAGSTNIMYEG